MRIPAPWLAILLSTIASKELLSKRPPTVAPGRGSPVSSLTVPVIVFCCAQPSCRVSSPKKGQ